MPAESYVNYDFDLNDFELYKLTVTRPMLNEIMNILSSNNHVDVMVNGDGNISFDIPESSEIEVRSYNIIKDMEDRAVGLQKIILLEKDEERKKILELEKDKIILAIEVVSDIINSGEISTGDTNEQEEDS
jgi:hypothetical protein